MTRSGLALAVLALLAFGSACDSGGQGPSPEGLSIQLITAPNGSDPFEGVGFIGVRAEGDAVESELAEVVPYTPGGSVALDQMPFAVASQVAVEGWTTGADGQPGAIVSRGRSLPVSVKAGDAARALRVLFARVNSFVPAADIDFKSPQSLAQPRVGHSATLTRYTVESGEHYEVVLAGGGTLSNAGAAWWAGTDFDSLHSSVEAYDEVSQRVVARAPMLQARAWHTATPMSSGQIIIAGGYGAAGNPLREVELYNPPGILGGTAKPLPPMAVARAGHTADLLDASSRMVVFVGGDAEGTWELWDPVNGSSGVRALPDNQRRAHHSSTKFFLPGRIEPALLIAGGETDALVHQTTMLFDSVAETMIPVAQPLPGGKRTQHTATYVANRNFIFVAGGFTQVSRLAATATIDVFDIPTQSFRTNNEGFRMATARGGHAAALNPNNVIVVTGGLGDEPVGSGFRPLSSVEVVHEFVRPGDGLLEIKVASSYTTGASAPVPVMPNQRVGHRAVALDNGMTMMFGGASTGVDGAFQMVAPLMLYNPL